MEGEIDRCILMGEVLTDLKQELAELSVADDYDPALLRAKQREIEALMVVQKECTDEAPIETVE